MIQRKTSFTLILVLLTSTFLVGCDDTKAVNNFTLTTNRIARYTEDLMRIVDEAKNQQFLNAAQATVVIRVARQGNSVNSNLVNEAAKYIGTDSDGKRVLRFTEQGKADVIRLATSLRDISINLVNDPILNTLPPETRAKINLITSGLSAAALSAYTFATKIKPVKS